MGGTGDWGQARPVTDATAAVCQAPGIEKLGFFALHTGVWQAQVTADGPAEPWSLSFSDGGQGLDVPRVDVTAYDITFAWVGNWGEESPLTLFDDDFFDALEEFWPCQEDPQTPRDDCPTNFTTVIGGGGTP